MSGYMKRLTAPRSWPVKRKAGVWITKPAPGPHAIENSMPMVLVMRDMLKLCDNAREAKRIIGNRDILVDGRPVRDAKLPIGIMDVISVPKLKANYRMLLDDKGKLTLEPISEDHAAWKLCRIESKNTISGGRTQLNLHDGRNILLEKDAYKTGDVLKVEVPSQKILDCYALGEGSMAMVVSGAHAGETKRIEEYSITRRPTPNLVRFKDGTMTVKGNVFVIGTKGPEIKLPEGSAL